MPRKPTNYQRELLMYWLNRGCVVLKESNLGTVCVPVPDHEYTGTRLNKATFRSLINKGLLIRDGFHDEDQRWEVWKPVTPND